MVKTIAVTGAKGQLGTVLQGLAPQFPQFTFVFTDVDELDITDIAQVRHFFNTYGPKYLINCAAYTAVDKAETDKLANKLNAEAVELLAIECKLHKTKLIHISTDYVFDGISSAPYVETDYTNPISAYGQTKAAGEEAIALSGCEGYILRTSWLYSVHGHNFLKTILRLAKERETLNIVYDQIGTPTLADDLAGAIMALITALNNKQKIKPGIFHYSNEGVCSWFDFAHAIVEIAGLHCKVLPILTSQYPTPATRPAVSILNKNKLKETLGIEIPHWRDSLNKVMAQL
jgi:dTDP-4-dehydrorhamnose reductase